MEVVTRESGFEPSFSIQRGEYWVSLTILIGKMGQNPLFRSRLSILGQPPSDNCMGFGNAGVSPAYINELFLVCVYPS